MSMFLSLGILASSALLSWPLGRYLTAVMQPPNRPRGIQRVFESAIGRVTGSASAAEQNWKNYSISMLTFNGVMFGVCWAILTAQTWLPLNPDRRPALEPSLVFHTAASFTSNTNLQHYSGEVSLSYFSQVFAMMWLQFISAATGLAALAALARGLAGRPMLGNFYRDVVRATFGVLLPVSFVAATLLLIGGLPMTFQGAAAAKTLEGIEQTIARGPVAAFVAIKQVGTNGGGFFGPNSTHPLENPGIFSNAIECMSILAIPMACVWMFGFMTRRVRHAAVVFAVMALMLAANVGAALYLESAPAAALEGLHVAQQYGNLEGKELRFGMGAGPLWAALTTATSNGSVNCMHDSLNPLTGLVPLAGMWLNVVFGGVGVGMINMFLYIIAGVFICGMMVGRTPEYLTRKVETREMRLAMLAILVHPLFILGGTAIFAATPWGAGSVNNPGPHGFTEILYEFSSASANNGSGFEGLADNTVPWNIATGAIMLLARFIPILLPLAIAGSLGSKKATPENTGTLRTDTPLFGVVILGSVMFVGALLFLPVAVLGPIAEHLASVIR